LLSTATLPNPNNTYLNQLGCSLVQLATGKVQANTPQTAPTYLFTSGVKAGLLAYELDNVPVSTPGGEAGKVNGAGLIFYGQANPGQKFDSAIITPDGKYLLGGSSRNNDAVFACRNPLGDPGDPRLPLRDVGTFALTTDASPNNTTGVQCMQIGQGGDSRVKALAVGFDGQPYIAGLNIVSNFTTFPACIAANFGVPPGTTTDQAIALAFAAHSANHCGTATPNKILNTSPDGTAAIKVETFALVSHGQYLYRAIKNGVVFQAKVASTGVTAQREFMTGLANPTGVGFEEGLKSTMIFDDPSTLSLAGRELIYKLPICEDMP
jgi:hypothetical protein